MALPQRRRYQYEISAELNFLYFSVTDIQRPPTSCETEYDCVNKGRCIHNWPEETEKEELARMLLPDFEPSDYWPVCQCTRLPDGRMPKGPRCEDGNLKFLLKDSV